MFYCTRRKRRVMIDSFVKGKSCIYPGINLYQPRAEIRFKLLILVI